MKTWHVELRREAHASLVIEAETQEEAESKAYSQVREHDFGYGNLYTETVEEIKGEVNESK
jgi:hypothetical protein